MSDEAKSFRDILRGVPASEYGERYRDHLMEQYKLYLELADKISDRRSQTNTFFLTINTGLISAIGIAVLVSDKTLPARILLPLLLSLGAAAILLCYSWYRSIKSYRGLNTTKFSVVHEIEKQLPVRPYDAEWECCGRGENKKLYLPFTHVEIFVPWIFIGLYAGLIVYGLYLAIWNNP